MRFPIIAATIVALMLIACSAPKPTASGTGPENTPIATPDYTESSATGALLIPKSPENTFVETPEYTGVIFSENAASVWSFLFDPDSTGFWEPSIDDVSRAEECIRRYLVSVQQDPDSYQKGHAAYILENLEKYRRQYVGIVVDGEERIWCNSFHSDESFPDWESDPVYVLDGGNHFWEIEYIPLKDECVQFHVHGEA